MERMRKQYRYTLNAVGGTMFFWSVLFYVLMTGAVVIGKFLPELLPTRTAEVIGSILYDVCYLGAFMLAGGFYYQMSKRRKTCPIPFQIRLSWRNFALIFAGMTCAFSFAWINSVLVSALSLPQTPSILQEATAYAKDYSFVLRFITIGLVPAFCEEFLFRGVILSNLRPYGNAAAILVSSLMFSMMHGNVAQFLYTLVAGIIMGTICVLTDSIWPSTLLHMINNSVSVLQESLSERFAPESAYRLMLVVECVIFAIGIVCIAYLAATYRSQRTKAEPSSEDYRLFGRLPKPGAGGVLTYTVPVRTRDFVGSLAFVFVLYSVVSGIVSLLL